ncbi:MAG: YchJ family metal-binding protein [Rhodoferax sp.]|nr:YchJ family metal-binding protein [Rhodoferax sp.]
MSAPTVKTGRNVTSKVNGKGGPVLTYGQCCGRWLEADASQGPSAPDAQHLMRSRYTAFVLEREAYLLATWQASRRPGQIEFEPGVKWLGLEVRDVRVSGADTAEVEFVARQRPTSGPATRLHERSRFVLEAGLWLYLDGVQL